MIYDKTGVVDKNYNQKFIQNMRREFNVQNDLLRAKNSLNDYLLPAEFNEAISNVLKRENITRQLCTTITMSTNSRFIFPITKPNAQWCAEFQAFPLNTEVFDKKTIEGYKLVAGSSIVEDLLGNDWFDVESHLAETFGKVLASQEEQAILAGTGFNQPTGIVKTISADSDCYITAAGKEILPTDLIKLQKSLPRSFRRNAVWLVSDSALEQIQSTRDLVQNFVWNFNGTELAKNPPTLLGSPIFCSPYLPEVESGKIPVIYGDFNYLWIIERGGKTIKTLKEINILQSLIPFIVTERLDTLLTDKNAIRGLKIK